MRSRETEKESLRERTSLLITKSSLQVFRRTFSRKTGKNITYFPSVGHQQAQPAYRRKCPELFSKRPVTHRI